MILMLFFNMIHESEQSLALIQCFLLYNTSIDITFGVSPNSKNHLHQFSVVYLVSFSHKWLLFTKIKKKKKLMSTEFHVYFMFINIPFLFIFAALQEDTDILKIKIKKKEGTDILFLIWWYNILRWKLIHFLQLILVLCPSEMLLLFV